MPATAACTRRAVSNVGRRSGTTTLRAKRGPGRNGDVWANTKSSLATLPWRRSFEINVLHIPGHTLGAVGYVVEDAVFTGDTLFVGGCGRLFEGTPAQMYESLSGKLGRLPAATRVYCGHEYTVSNLRFAVHAEPDNRAAADKLVVAQAMRERGEPTVPSTIGEELAQNPFMRCDEPSLAARYPGATAGDVLGAVRKAKDGF